MEPLTLVREGVDFNYWARDRQLKACAVLSADDFARPLGGSFPSLRETFAHMVAVEWLWVARWRGRTVKALIPASEFPTLAVVAERWSAVEREVREFVNELDEESLKRPLICTSTRGEQWTYPLWRLIVHFLNHQSYHRGQVTTLLRMLGVTPPRIDYLLGVDADFAR
ncbi:MAG: DinB family protein [Acidobacteriales bacterium]|nr:DinB family protein [Terriglobales bacterium]